MEYILDSSELQRAIEKVWAVNFVDIAQRGLTRAMITGQNLMVDVTPVWVTANLSQNWYYVIDFLTWTLANRKKYGLYVHEWTQPHWAPAAALKDWAELKWIPVRALQWSIAKKWTKANPFVKNTMDQNKDQMVDEFYHTFTTSINNIF